MQKYSVLILCLLILFISCEKGKNVLSPEEENIEGTWTGWGYSETTNVTHDVTYVFTQNGSKLSGIYTNNTTGGSYPIDGTIEGDKVNIRLTDGSYTWIGKGTLSGDKISGTFTSTSEQNGTFEITKYIINIAGTWTGWGHSETTNVTHDVTYVFTQNGSKLSGLYTNNTTGGSYPIDGTIEGYKVNIRLTDGSYTWTGKGTISGNKISGTYTSTSEQNGTFEINKN